jgi:DNA-binding response OmpR family regulator
MRRDPGGCLYTAQMHPQPHILIVEDEPLTSMAWSEELSDAGYRVSTAAEAVDALEILRSEPVSAMIADIGLPGTPGDVLAAASRSEFPSLSIIMVTGFGIDGFAHMSVDAKVRVLEKPVTVGVLIHHLQAML